mgnify:CR=1 FL=1
MPVMCSPAATVTSVAGTPETLGFFGDGGAATDALLYQPQALAKHQPELLIRGGMYDVSSGRVTLL